MLSNINIYGWHHHKYFRESNKLKNDTWASLAIKYEKNIFNTEFTF